MVIISGLSMSKSELEIDVAVAHGDDVFRTGERDSLWVPLVAPFAAAGVTLKDSNGRGWRKRLMR